MLAAEPTARAGHDGHLPSKRMSATLASSARPASYDTAMGPLEGVRVVEVAGIGPGPFCAMLLADMGAEVLRVERPAAGRQDWPALFGRGRRSVAVDLKHPEGAGMVLDLAASADALVEGFRPGVAERLGIGPGACLARNPRLVYGRVTGWGQEGPLAQAAGHDIDYIALAGALHPIGPAGGAPVPPLNLVGDFGGGGMLLALGVVAALLEAGRSGRGQVVDAAMVDGAALLTTELHELRAAGLWSDRRGANLLDGGAPFYDVYETADGGHLAVGALEPGFYAALLELVGLDGADLPAQRDRDGWPALRERLAALFRTRTRDEWCRLLEGTDACVAPVLSPTEAPAHPHNRARGTFVDVGGVVQPAPAPRFSRTPCARPEPPVGPGEHTDGNLAAWGIDPDEVARLRAAGAVG
jgi:alpha-methylacyl-CoA racemase